MIKASESCSEKDDKMKGLGKKLCIAAIVLNLTGCDPQLETRTKKTIEKNFEAAAITIGFERSWGDNIPKHRLEFSASKRGAYLIEGWNSSPRPGDDDGLDKIVDYVVTELPFKKEIDFSRRDYRVEITYSDGSSIERATILFPNGSR